MLRTRFLALGPKMVELEERIAAFIGRRFGVAVNSGTSGLHLLVRALGIGEGDEVITTPFSFVASANCVLFERARPVFVDINPDTLNIEPGLIENAITPKTKAILPVHAFGQPAKMDKIMEIAEHHGLRIIEDACEAIGAKYGGEMAGTLGDAAVFAFYPNKQVTTGEGGMIVTDNEEVARLCRSMRNQGRGEGGGWLDHERLGYNYRLDELSAAMGVAQMERLPEILAKRARVAEMYNRRLAEIEEVRVPYISPQAEMSWF
ncbi:MAG: DegT/DnrJ/EryC1/StrS family aminotransferase, partial [Chloroflexota bacterium]